MTILDMSTTGAVMIIAVAIVRAIFTNKLPKKTFKLLWVVVLGRLLLPFQVPFRFSIYSIINWVKGTRSVLSLQEIPTNQIPNTAFAPAITLENTNSLNISPMFLVWVAGVILLGMFFIVTHLRCRKEYKTALPTENAYVKNWLEKYKIKRTIKIVVSDKITAPLTYGVWKPVILLPKTFDLSDEEKLGYILTHEYTHIRHFDIVYKWILVATLCIHWFNPLVWVMYILANRDLELSCDEAVVRTLGNNLKSDYALALIGLEEKKRRFTPVVNNFSKNAIEERIVSIMKIKKTSAIALIMALFLVVGVTTVFATSAKEDTEVSAVASGYASEVNAQPDYSIYKDFGLTYSESTDKLYYQGKSVRYFEDFYSLGDGAYAGIDFFDKDGIIDVHGIRDLTNLTHNPDGSFDPSGKLIAVEPYAQAEFNARNISELINPPRAVTYDGEPMSEAEAIESFAEYKPYGLEYDAKKERLYYDGKLVRNFLDVMSSNGESLEGGNFSGTMRKLPNDDGEVDVYTVRDFAVVDKEGNGKLLAVKAYSDEEFDKITLDLTATTITNTTSIKENIFLWPTIEKEISSGFNEYPGHDGIDIKGAVGTVVYASASGTVTTAETGYTGYGNYIKIDHGGGYETLYAHCNELYVAVGESVVAGQIIATIGSTGTTTRNCLHFGIREYGMQVDPLGYYAEEMAAGVETTMEHDPKGTERS